MKLLADKIKNLKQWQVTLLLFVVSVLLYGNTLFNNYALDDAIVITKNEFTQQGLLGIKPIFTTESFTGFFGVKKDLVAGGRYRPLSIATFAIENEFFGNNPTVSHLINILLYTLLGWLVFKVLQMLLSYKISTDSSKIVALATTILFLIHPIHTEVVANIKGRDEILSLLLSLLAFFWILKPLKNKILHVLAIALAVFAALLSKENAIAFVFIIPAALWYFNKINYKKIVTTSLVLFVPTLVFLWIRTQVLGGFSAAPVNELMNNPFVQASDAEKYATIFYTWIIYLKLLIFPHPLTFDYYPYHIPLMNFRSGWVWLSLMFIAVLLVVFVAGAKKRSVYSFSIIAFIASFILMANLFFSVGTFMNERFMFVPSLFWSLAMVYLAWQMNQKSRLVQRLILVVVVYALLFYPVKTIARNMAWKNDFTLFITDVKTSKNSAKSNTSAGGKLWEEGKKTLNKQTQKNYYQLSEKYLRRAVQIHPAYADAWVLLGNLLYDSKKAIPESAKCYLTVLKRNPQHKNAKKNIDIVLQNTSDRTLQLKYYQELIKLLPNDFTINYRLGVLYGRFFNDLNQGIMYLEKAVSLNNKNTAALKDLGTAYGMSGQVQKAYETFKRAIVFDSSDYQVYINLGVSSRQLGKNVEAAQYFEKGERLKQYHSK